MINGTGYTI